jgi:hypothetical protein
MVIGPGHARIAARASSLMDVTPMILDVIDAL